MTPKKRREILNGEFNYGANEVGSGPGRSPDRLRSSSLLV